MITLACLALSISFTVLHEIITVALSIPFTILNEIIYCMMKILFLVGSSSVPVPTRPSANGWFLQSGLKKLGSTGKFNIDREVTN